MDIAVPPTIYVAGPNPNERSSRLPTRQAPIAEPGESPVRGSTVKGTPDPISVPPLVNNKGALAVPTGTGTRLDVQV